MKRPNKCAGKKKYAYLHKAEAISLRVFRERRVPTRVYECPTCLDFHLTSKGIDISRIEALKRSIPNSPKINKRLRKQRYRNNRTLKNKTAMQFLTHFYGDTTLLTLKLICGLLKNRPSKLI